MNQAIDELRERRGPAFDAWAFGLIEYAHGQLERLLELESVDSDELAA